MAKTKAAKTVTAKIGVAFNDEGRYVAFARYYGGSPPTIRSLIRTARDEDARGVLPHACVVEVELTPPKGKVLKVKQVKP